MFLSALQGYIVAIIVCIVVLQYAFALFCLLKLAYLDLPKKYYVLWNLFVLLIFFIGGAVFLVYYFKHPELRIPKDPAENAAALAETVEQEPVAQDEQAESAQPSETAEQATEETSDDGDK